MHLVVVGRAVYAKHPLVATTWHWRFKGPTRKLVRALRSDYPPMPWINLDLEYAKQVMGDDIYSYGVKPNLATSEVATQYSYEQGLTERRLEVSGAFRSGDIRPLQRRVKTSPGFNDQGSRERRDWELADETRLQRPSEHPDISHWDEITKRGA
jgi:hypothetical protein